MYDTLLETYELISRLESRKPVFGLNERLFITQTAFHTGDMELIKSLIKMLADEKHELTTGCMSSELEKLKNTVDDKEVADIWNMMVNCSDIQNEIISSFSDMQEIYQQLVEEYKSDKPLPDKENKIKRIIQALESDIKKVNASIEKVIRAWEEFFRYDICIQTIKNYINKNPDCQADKKSIANIEINDKSAR